MSLPLWDITGRYVGSTALHTSDPAWSERQARWMFKQAVRDAELSARLLGHEPSVIELHLRGECVERREVR